jgi:hypothetical protein
MFKNFIKNLFKEPTNVADISPVTFNSPGTYNPRYGKAKVKFVGKGGDGYYSPGSAYGYWNTGNTNPSNSNSTVYMAGVSFDAQATITYGGVTVTNYASGTLGAQYGAGVTSNSGGWYFTNNYFSISTNSEWAITYTGYGGSSINFSPGSSATTYVGVPVSQTISVNAATANGTSVYTGYWNASYTNLGDFVVTGYYSDTANSGASYTFDGITVPGGYGNPATAISSTPIPYRDLWSITPITIPSGGYATINFSL